MVVGVGSVLGWTCHCYYHYYYRRVIRITLLKPIIMKKSWTEFKITTETGQLLSIQPDEMFSDVCIDIYGTDVSDVSYSLYLSYDDAEELSRRLSEFVTIDRNQKNQSL
jgi:hypothetical protein